MPIVVMIETRDPQAQATLDIVGHGYMYNANQKGKSAQVLEAHSVRSEECQVVGIVNFRHVCAPNRMSSCSARIHNAPNVRASLIAKRRR